MAVIKPVNVGYLTGINNVTPETQLHMGDEEKGTELVNGVNIDLDKGGRPRLRPGSTEILDLADCHSIWSNAAKTRAFFVTEDELRELTRVDGTWGSTLLVSGLTQAALMVFAEAPDGYVYYTNGIQRGRIGATAAREWGVEIPTPTPALSAGGGNLPEGIYQVAVTYVNDLGEEGGAVVTAPITLAATGGVTMTIPVPVSAEVEYVNIYCTRTNGDRLYLAKTVPAGLTSTTLADLPGGAEIETLNFMPIPPGSQIAYYNGRLYVASSNVVWYSEPYRLGLCRRARNFVPFPDTIQMMQATEGGLWIATAAQTYQLPGDGPLETSLEYSFPYGAIPGTAFALPDNQSVGWYSERGIVIATPDGKVKNQTEGRVILQPYQSGRAFVRERDGIRQYVGVMKDSASANPLRVGDYAEAEIRRRAQ